MWHLAPAVLLLVSLALGDPQQGYQYLPPSIPFNPTGPCEDVTSVVISTNVKQNVVPTTSRQVDVQYTTTVVYSQRVVPTTIYQTQFRSRVDLQTSYVQRETQVVKEQVVASTRYAQPVVKTQYVTSTRVVPQVSYVVREQVQTKVVPVERVNTRYETEYRDQVQYTTVPVQQTSVYRVTGRNVISTAYRTQVQSSVVQRSQAPQTQYRTTTLVQNQVQTQTVPSPPVVQTKYATSQRVVPTTLVNNRVQTVYVTRTAVVTQTQYRTQTQVQTKYVPQEVVVTVDVPREVVRTEYRTQVVPNTQYQTSYRTQVRQADPVYRTQTQYATSVVRVPGQNRVVSREVISTNVRQQVVYKTENVQRPVTVTKTVNVPCAKSGYNYPEPQIQFNY